MDSTDELVTKRFLADVENEYDSLLGFRTKFDGLKNECQRLNEERDREIAKLDTIPYLGSMISALFRKGVTEVDILQISSLLHNPDFLDVWSSFKAKRAKEADLRPKEDPGVVKNQNLREEAGKSNKDQLEDRGRASPAAARNRGESDEEIEAQVNALHVRAALEDEPDVIIPTPYLQHNRNRGSGKSRYPIPA